MKKTLKTLVSFVLLTALVFANTAGPNGGTGAGASWTTPTNVATTNAAYATCSANNSSCAGKLSASAFGFSIPGGATINGITLAAVVHCATAAACDFSNISGVAGTGVCVTKVAATCIGTSKTDATGWAATDVTITFGNGADLWGTTFTQAEINAAGFGAVVDPEVNIALNKVMSIDSLLITVTFTPAATSASGFLKMFGFNIPPPRPQTQTRPVRI